MASKQRRPYPMERRRPQLLKDFLQEDSNSCSSSGFRSFPRFPSSSTHTANSKLLEPSCRFQIKPSLPPSTPVPSLPRSRSRSRVAAEATISLLQKLLNAVKTPSLASALPRSLSHKPSSKQAEKVEEVSVGVRVKDILRWKSFRDLIDGQDGEEEQEEKSQPLDFSASTDLRTMIASRAGSTPGVCRDYLDITAEELPPPWLGGEGRGGGESVEAGTGAMVYSQEGSTSKGEVEPISGDQDDQHSPVSVLDSPFRDEEESISSFDQTLVNVERTKQRLLESIKWFESLAGVVQPIDLDDHFSEEEEINHLVDSADEESEEKNKELAEAEEGAEHPVYVNIKDSFFMDDLKTKGSHHKHDELEAQTEKKAKAYTSGRGVFSWGREILDLKQREECVRDMEKEAWWSEFEEQKDLEVGMFNALLDELLLELVVSFKTCHYLDGLPLGDDLLSIL